MKKKETNITDRKKSYTRIFVWLLAISVNKQQLEAVHHPVMMKLFVRSSLPHRNDPPQHKVGQYNPTIRDV